VGWLNDKLFVDLSRRSREKKVAMLRDNIDLTAGRWILDVGGQVDYAQAQLLVRSRRTSLPLGHPRADPPAHPERNAGTLPDFARNTGSDHHLARDPGRNRW
jgi:hypothetical protein